MTVKIWNSYSCNNSSSFRIVARFANPESAAFAAGELREFFKVHATEVDNLGDYSEEPSQAQLALGTKHGFTWSESLYWGDGGLEGDEPEVFTRDEVLIVQHTYCGGLGDVSGMIKALGATDTNDADERTINVSLLFRRGGDGLDTELTDLFEKIEARKDQRYGELKAPWAEHECYGNMSWFRDAGTVGIYLPIDPRDLAALERWLADHQIDKPSIEIEQRDDLAKFEAIGKATCTACSGALEYLDPRIHDIETPQLVCKPCGGLYDVATFLPKS